MQNRHRRFRTLVIVLVAAAVAAAIPASSAQAAPIFYNGAGSAPRISIIGDSTIAALRWTNQFEPLKRFNFTYDAESCRRTVLPSCRGREGYAPDNTINAMRRLSGQLGSVLVIMGGYDDPSFGFGSAVDTVMAEAARQGIPTVLWLTLRTNVTYVGPGSISYSGTFRAINQVLLQKAIQYGPRLQLADWASYSANHPEWFFADGIHFRASGANVVANYIASQAARVLAGQVVTPAAGLARPLPPGSLRAAVGHGVGSGRVRLNWGAPTPVGGGPVTDYVIQRSWNNGLSWVTLDDGASTTRTYTATNLTNRATYQFRVAARNQRGLGAWSNVVTASPRPTIPSAPRSLLAWAYPGRVTLAWIVPSSSGGEPIYAYLVQRSTDGGRTWHTWSTVPATARSYTATGLTNGATYQFRVAARNAVGDSRVSNIVTATPRLMRPWPPRSLIATPGNGQVALQWTSPSSDGGLPIYAYVVQGSTDGGRTWRTLSSVPATNRFYTATGLTNGISYQFRVAARNALGDSRVSNIVSATPAPTALLAATAAEEPTTTTMAPTTTVAPTTTTPITATSAPSVDIAAATIGDIVWVDADGDGLQDPGETGLEGLDVALLDSSGVELGRDTTDQFGGYEFAALAAGSYMLELELPDGYGITLADQGFDDEVDSDLLTVDEQLGTARTDVFGVPADRPGSVDLGLVPVEEPSGESTTTSSAVVDTAAPPDTATPTTASTTTEPPPTEPPTTTAAPTTVAATTTPTTTLSPTTTVATGG